MFSEPQGAHQNTNLSDKMLRQILGDDSDGKSECVLVDPSFTPETFTVGQRNGASFLDISERSGQEFIRSSVLTFLKQLEDDRVLPVNTDERTVETISASVSKLFEDRFQGRCISEQVFNQEAPDVIKRLVVRDLFGSLEEGCNTHRRFNALGRMLAMAILKRNLLAQHDLHYVHAFSVASGLVGLDMKGAKAAASALTSAGIELLPLQDRSVDSIVEHVAERLDAAATRGFVVDAWEPFSELALHSGCHIVWFTDDYIETFFDLYFIQRLLSENIALTVTIVPRNGPHGNDASFLDVREMIASPEFSLLNDFYQISRLRVCPDGPRMGTVNLRKLAPAVIDEVIASTLVYIKGCRSHEMVQGGINAVTFTSFVVAREFTESETGLDARAEPLAFFRLSPGEYAYYGFEERATRRKTLEGGRQLRVCFSTLLEHESRKTMADLEGLVQDIAHLADGKQRLPQRCSQANAAELALVENRLSDVTRDTYDRIAQEYRGVRSAPKGDVNGLLEELLAMARDRTGMSGALPRHIKVLDVGTGHGRDLVYLSKIPDVDAVGIDNAHGFIEIMNELASEGTISAGSYREVDMRKMDCFADSSFDVVRHNASIVHTPLLPYGLGADQVLRESWRVLGPEGLLYLLVKAGEGLTVIDTGEGLGCRVFQLYTLEDLTSLLTRTGFSIIEYRRSESQRPSGTVEWLTVFAQKASETNTEQPGG